MTRSSGDNAVSNRPGSLPETELAEQQDVARSLVQRLAEANAPDILAQMEDALRRWPSSRDLHIARLLLLEKTGDRDALDARLAASRELFPNCPEIALVAFRTALADSEFASAADLLCAAIWPSDQSVQTRQQCLDALLDAPVDDEFAKATLLRLLDVDPDCSVVLVRLAAQDVRHERHGRALEWLERAEACAPLSKTANMLRIEALLNATDWDDIFSRSLERALLATPDARRLYGLKYDFHEKRGEQEAARAALALALDRFPAEPWFALRAFRQHLSDQDREGAALLFSERIWRSSLPEQARRGALGTLTREWKDPETLETFLTGLLYDAPDDRFALVKLASLATRRRRHLEAVRYIERAERHGPLPAEAESMRVNMLILGGDTRASLALAKQQLAAHPDRKDLVRRANIAASLDGSQDDVTQTMRQAITQWPTDASIIQRYNRAIIPEAEDQTFFEHVASFSRANSVDGRWRYQFALACLRRNETPRARAMLRNLAGDEQVGFEAERLLGILNTLPPGEWDERARFSNDATQDVRVVKVASAEATIVVMAGLHGGLGNLPLTHIDVLLQDHPVNVIYLRDNRWSAFTTGVPGLGPDETSSLAALSALCADLGKMPVITFGGSLAGWSAMRYGALMGARVAISLAGPTQLAVQEDHPARFAQHYLTRMLPESVRDLPGLLSRSPALRVIHVYGARNAKDCMNAARLQHLSNVSLVPMADCDHHFVAADLVANGGFHPLIERAIADARTASA